MIHLLNSFLLIVISKMTFKIYYSIIYKHLFNCYTIMTIILHKKKEFFFFNFLTAKNQIEEKKKLHHNKGYVKIQNICKQLVIIGGYDRLRNVKTFHLFFMLSVLLLRKVNKVES